MGTSVNRAATPLRSKQYLISELQTRGVRLADGLLPLASRKGGAGPSDHRAMTVMGTTVMVPVLTYSVKESPFRAEPAPDGDWTLFRDTEPVGAVSFPARPGFYGLTTADGVPYWKIAQLHSSDVLATTVLQNCFRYNDPQTRCQFCAIGESLHGGRTVATKTDQQLAEVAEAAEKLDGVTHMVMTTGTPSTPDRGAAVLSDCARAVKARTRLPIQAQCEPPDDFGWFDRLEKAGVDTIGIHLEALDEDVRARVMPSKSEIPVSYYMEAFKAAVAVFGRAQVSTYLLAGLGDTRDGLIEGCRKLIAIGVYPFVVPFVPITGTALAHHAPPTTDFMVGVLDPLSQMLREAGMRSDKIKAGCGKCGACSALSTFEA